MSKEDALLVTKVRTKLKGDASWLTRKTDPGTETTEDKPWLAEIEARRQNRVETSPVSSPIKPPETSQLTQTAPPPIKPPTTGYRSRGIFQAPSSPANDFSKTTQFTKKPSETYKKIAPHTVKPTSDNQGSQLSSEEQEKRTEAASNVLKKSSVRQRSYVLSAAKKFESKEPDNTTVNHTVSFVAKRVEIADDDESPATPPPASSAPVSTVAPVASAASAPQPTPRVDTTVKTTVIEAPKAPVVDEALPVTKTDPFEDMTPASTKVATPLPELIAECIQAVSANPQVSGEAEDDPLAEINIRPSQIKTWPPPDETELPESPALLINTAEPPVATSTTPLIPEPVTPVSTTPLIPVQVSSTPLMPSAISPTPASPPLVIPEPVSSTPLIPAPLSTTQVSSTPLSLTQVSSKPLIPTPQSPTLPSSTPLIPTPVSSTPLSPTQVSSTPLIPAPQSPTLPSTTPLIPTPVSSTPLSPTLVSSTPLIPTQVSPPPVSPTPVLPEPLSPTSKYSTQELSLLMDPSPVVTTTTVTVITESEVELVSPLEPALQPEPVSQSPKPSSNVDTLAALSDTLISFDTSSVKVDEPALVKEEGGSATENRAEDKESDTDEDDFENEYNYDDPDTDSDDDDDSSKPSDCGAMSDDLQAVDSDPEESADPDPVSPGRPSTDLLSGQDSQPIPTKTSGPLDLLSADLLATHTETLSTQREEEKPTDETAEETQRKEDNANVWSSRVTTEITTISSTDPFDPYPIGTTSPNSSSDLLQPLSTISINRESTEYQRSSPEIRMSSNALESLADDVIPIDTDTTRLSSRHSWATSWETSAPQPTNTEESQEAEAGNLETVIKFERKSSENDSPWDRWTSPTVYSISRDTGEDEDEEERNRETTTVTTVTTVREIHSQPEPVMDRYESYSRTVIEEEQRVPTPEPEHKKGFVYLKEYVNATEMSSLNSGDGFNGENDYYSSSSFQYPYSPSSRVQLSSTCTYCGQQVGDDSKITIESLGINSHPHCFQCGVCKKAMGDLLSSMYIHQGTVHCDACYAKV